MKIGVISDTHGLLRNEVIEKLEGCNYIIHAGDVGGEEIISKLDKIAKTFVVRGNNDVDSYGMSLPEYREIEMNESLIYVVHNKVEIPENLNEVELIIYGHSHKYCEEKIGDKIYLNPGSCGKKRFSLPLTMAIVDINEGNIEITKLELD